MSHELREMNLRAQQSGAALMAMLAVFVLGASWWLLSALSTPTNRVALEREHNARVLAEAKQALLGWAARNAIDNTDNNPGRLPCPEPAGAVGNPATEGIMQNICGAGTVIGRLPWRSLGLPKLLDAKGEPLWYVLSSGWKLNAGGANEWLGINSNAVGQLALDGTGNGAVAMLIAPGAELALAPNPNQSAAGCIARAQRRGTTPQNHLDYVECHSVAGANVRTAVVDNATNRISNDQTVVLTAPEVLAAIEPAVAARITRDVIPVLQGTFGATYNTNQWGPSVSAMTPVLPFAAPFADTSASAFQGAPGQMQGLLPLSRSQCNPLTDPLCDPNFVQWAINDPNQVAYPNPSAVQSVFSGRTADLAGTPDCVSSSTSQLVTCSISYSGQCGGGLNLAFLLGGRCYLEFQVSVRARAKNVGSAARTFDATPIAVSESPWSLVSSATPINTVGSAAADIRVELPPASCACFPVLCLLIGCNASNTVTVTVPIAIFPDHPSLTELFASPRNWEWFMRNNWHHVVYYSISPSHAASAAAPHNCSTLANCITVTGGSLPPNSRAIIAFAGRSLSDAARPSANLNDYLDTAINRDGNTAFEQKRFDKTFNDRFFAISNY